MSSELFELKVMIEADGWHEVAALMDTVDRALDPHRQVHDGAGRWAVMARRVPDVQSRELLRFIDQCGRSTSDNRVVTDGRHTA